MILTPAEHTVLEGILTGATNVEIGEVMNRKEKTIKAHVTQVLKKCGYATRCKLIVGFHATRDFVINSTDDGLFQVIRFDSVELPTPQESSHASS